VGLIQSQTAFKVSSKMAEAASKRPEVVGQVLNDIGSNDPEILNSVLDIMETEKLLESHAKVDVVPKSASYMLELSDK
ncbi:MAG: SPFH/Band 7/PHB domain protein, partial [Verrucomicrobia bacterium]|nr:SPFH/Band 7/PHB domain protein [Verrucomicrobiota bacterium]